ncbi:MAG TPA: TolC family protein [Bacteroidetes bacterium]|nr:outer membrane protein TolC precursor [bacterium BMS3Bbin03]HDK36096.1 TolC family protein [Bacteroidota bacterium]
MKRFWSGVFAFFLLFGMTFPGLSQTKSLNLGQCIKIALQANPQVKNAYRQINLAEGGITSARATILPSISGNASSARAIQAPSTFVQDVPIYINPITKKVTYAQREIIRGGYARNAHNLGVYLNQTIFDGGKWWNRIREANANYRSVEWKYKATRQNIILQVTQRFFELLKASQLLEVYEQSVKSTGEQYRKTQSMYEVGAVAQVDVYRAKVNLGLAKMNAIMQRNKVLIAKSNLNVTLGRNPGTPIELSNEKVGMEEFKGTAEDAKRQAFQMNANLKSFKEQISSYRYAIKVAKGDYLPQISARAGYSRFNTLFDRVYSTWDKNYGLNLSVSVNWNLFSGFQRAANVEHQNLNYLIAKENFSDQQRLLLQSVEQAFMNLQAYRQIYDINKENLKAAEEDLRLATERYKVGSGTLLEVIDAQVSLTKSKATLVNTKYDNLIALAQLYDSMGIIEQKIMRLLKE